MINLFKAIKNHIIAIVLVIGVILDQSTDLLSQLLTEISAPSWIATLLRIVIIFLGAIRLYYSNPPERIGGGGIKNPKKK